MSNLLKFISASLFSSLLSIVSSFFLARILSVEDRGAYQLLLTVLNYITVISSGGVGFAVVQSIRKNEYKGWEKYLLLSLSIAIGLGIFAHLFFHVSPNLAVFLISVLFSILYSYVLEISKIEPELKIYKILILLQPGLFLTIYLFVYFFIGSVSFEWINYFLSFILFIQSVFCVLLILKINNVYSKKCILFVNKISLLSIWLKQNLLQVFGFTTANIDKFIIAFFLGNYTLGLYAIGMTFDLLLSRVMMSLADYYYSGLINNNNNRIKLVIIFVVLILISSILIMSHISDYIIVTFFGEKYMEISPFVIWFVVNSILSGLSWILTQKMLILGKQVLIFFRQVISLVIFILLFLVLKEQGLNGVIYSLIVSSIVRLGISIYYHQKYKLFI